MSTFTDTHKSAQPSLDGANDLRPVAKTSFILKQEEKPAPKVKKTKTTTKES